jgi:hypothetical protein
MTAQASSNSFAEAVTAAGACAVAWSLLPMATSVPASTDRSTTGCSREACQQLPGAYRRADTIDW